MSSAVGRPINKCSSSHHPNLDRNTQFQYLCPSAEALHQTIISSVQFICDPKVCMQRPSEIETGRAGPVREPCRIQEPKVVSSISLKQHFQLFLSALCVQTLTKKEESHASGGNGAEGEGVAPRPTDYERETMAHHGESVRRPGWPQKLLST